MKSLPPWARLLAGLGLALAALPAAALVVRAPWSDLLDRLGSAAVRDALLLSLGSATIATIVAAAFGVPLALALAAARGRAARLGRAVVLAPMVVPPVVGGLALQATWSADGVVGGVLGGPLPPSLVAVVLAQVVVATPFLVVTVERGLRAIDPRIWEMAALVGAAPATVLWRVVLPLAGSALRAGVIVAWARAVGEFGATLVFAGAAGGADRTEPALTLPVAVFAQAVSDRGVAFLSAGLLLVISAATLGLFRDHFLGWGDDRPGSSRRGGSR